MKQSNRRKFIRNAALLPMGVACSSYAQQPITKKSESFYQSPSAKIKISLNAWSYNVPLFKYVRGEADGMSLFDLLDECAKLDFDAVDPTGYFFPGYPDVPSRQFINKFKRRAFELGLAISGTGIRNDFSTSDKEKRKADIELTKKWIDVAAQLGAPVIRVFAGNQPKGHSWDEAASWLSDSLTECAAYGEQNGVIVGIQNHGGMLTSAKEVLKIINMVQSDWLGAIVDTGYFLTDDPYADIEQVIPHAVNWQIKDLLKNRKGGPIDLAKVVSIIRASSYRGYVPIETLPIPGQEDAYDAYTRVPELLRKFREALG